MKIRTGVIGLGRIGSQWDCGALNRPPRTHVGTIIQTKNMRLCAVCDVDEENRKRFVREWNLDIPVYSSITAMAEKEELDVVAVATTPSSHYAIIKELFTYAPKIIFCEKPFCSNELEAGEIYQMSKEQGVGILVNYHRRWDKRISAIKEQVSDMLPPRYVQVLYGKGLLNYGSHAVNLLLHLFGRVKSVHAVMLSPDQKKMNDPSMSAIVTFESGLQVMLKGLDEVVYDLFEVDIYYPQMKIHLGAGGFVIDLHEAIEDSMIAGYTHLQKNHDRCSSEPVHGLAYAYEEIQNCVLSGTPYRMSEAETALQTLKILDAIKMSARNGQCIEL